MKAKLPREFYTSHIKGKRDYRVIKRANVEAYLYTNDKDRPAMMVFIGRAQKPYSHYHYLTENDRQDKLNKIVEAQNKHKRELKKRRQDQIKESTLQVGDILCSTWGYNMTIVDFYQVVEIIGKRTISARPIATKDEDTGYMSGYSMPVKDRFTGLKERYMVSHGSTIKINQSSRASLWDGKKKYFNHCD